MFKDKKDKPEVTQDKEPVKEALTNEQQVEGFDKEIEGYNEIITEFETQLKVLDVDLQEEDTLINKKVNEELDAFPESSPKGLLEKIYKLNIPKRGQLQESINKVNIALQHTQGKRNKVIREKQKLVAEIKETGLNELTNRLCETLQDMINMYLKAEAAFILFKERATELDMLDNRYDKRVDGKKYPSFFNEIAGLSLLRAGSLPGLTMTYFVETIQNIGKEAENPLKAGRFKRQLDKHISERGFQGSKGFIAPEGATADRQAEEAIGQVWEAGPTIPTVGE